MCMNLHRQFCIATAQSPNSPGFCSDMVSVTFCMKMRPLSCNFGLPSLVTKVRVDILFFGLFTLDHLEEVNLVLALFVFVGQALAFEDGVLSIEK
jgi:hypothetical protein